MDLKALLKNPELFLKLFDLIPYKTAIGAILTSMTGIGNVVLLFVEPTALGDGQLGQQLVKLGYELGIGMIGVGLGMKIVRTEAANATQLLLAFLTCGLLWSSPSLAQGTEPLLTPSKNGCKEWAITSSSTGAWSNYQGPIAVTLFDNDLGVAVDVYSCQTETTTTCDLFQWDVEGLPTYTLDGDGISRTRGTVLPFVGLIHFVLSQNPGSAGASLRVCGL